MLEPLHEGGPDVAAVSTKRVTVTGSSIGSTAETQQVLDSAAQHGVAAEVEVSSVQQVNKDVRFRCVIDNATPDSA